MFHVHSTLKIRRKIGGKPERIGGLFAIVPPHSKTPTREMVLQVLKLKFSRSRTNSLAGFRVLDSRPQPSRPATAHAPQSTPPEQENQKNHRPDLPESKPPLRPSNHPFLRASISFLSRDGCLVQRLAQAKNHFLGRKRRRRRRRRKLNDTTRPPPCSQTYSLLA